MAVICMLLASGGFVGAGYVSNSTADAAILTAQGTPRLDVVQAQGAGFDSLAAQGLGMDISFANTLTGAKKPATEQFLDLTNPNANTPHLARSVSAMRGDIPEISDELLSQVRKEILAAAYQGLGRSYVWGGTSFDHGWDCSGFVQWAYRQAGVALPRTEQWAPMVETNNPQPGDIVVQNPDGPNHWSHIGIYIGKGLMISALNPSVGTILHAPSDVSSSSSYFTMPAFAEADAKAKADAEAKENADAEKSAKPSGDATPGAPDSSAPGTPGTTAPGTPATPTPGTTNPTDPGTTTPDTGTPTPGPTDPGATPGTESGTPSAAPESNIPQLEVPAATPPSDSAAPRSGEPATSATAGF